MSDEQKKDTTVEEKVEETKAPEAAQKTSNETKPASPDASQGGEVEVPAKFRSIIKEIEKMSVLDLSELVKILEDKFGVSAAAPIGVAAVSGSVAAETGAEEKTEFNVELAAFGDNKISVIKVVRQVTEKGLKEAKDIVESAPVVIKEGIKKEEAEEIKQKLEEAGAQANLK